MLVKTSGEWRPTLEWYAKTSGEHRPVANLYKKVNGSWEELLLYPSPLPSVDNLIFNVESGVGQTISSGRLTRWDGTVGGYLIPHSDFANYPPEMTGGMLGGYDTPKFVYDAGYSEETNLIRRSQSAWFNDASGMTVAIVIKPGTITDNSGGYCISVIGAWGAVSQYYPVFTIIYAINQVHTALRIRVSPQYSSSGDISAEIDLTVPDLRNSWHVIIASYDPANDKLYFKIDNFNATEHDAVTDYDAIQYSYGVGFVSLGTAVTPAGMFSVRYPLNGGIGHASLWKVALNTNEMNDAYLHIASKYNLL